MQPKKLLTILLVVVLTIVCGALSVSATETNAVDVAVEVSSSTAIQETPLVLKPGAEVDVKVELKSNPGLCGLFSMALEYDADALELKPNSDNSLGTIGKIFEGCTEEGLSSKNAGRIVYFVNATNLAATNKTGTLLSFKFVVKSDYHGSCGFVIDDFEGMTKDDIVAPTISDSSTANYNKATVAVHNYGEPATVAADCTKAGTTTYTCAEDNCSDKTLVITNEAAKGHKPGAEATCTAPQKCTDCETELAPAKGHTPGAEATCKTAQTCTVCNTELAPKHSNHTYGEFVVDREATRKEDGVKSKTCSVCGDKVEEVIPFDGLSTVAIVIIIIAVILVLGAGGFCLYWFVIRKKNN